MGEAKFDVFKRGYSLEDTLSYFREIIHSKYDRDHERRILSALDFACTVHEGQLRFDQKTSYVIHPVRVALMLLLYDRHTTSKICIAALLHDVLEKPDVQRNLRKEQLKEQIREQFGFYVLKLVQSITEDVAEAPDIESLLLVKRRRWEQIMATSHEVRALKTFENLDNIISWKDIPEGCEARKKIPRWLVEIQELALPLAHATNSQAYNFMGQEYEYYVTCGFANQPITC